MILLLHSRAKQKMLKSVGILIYRKLQMREEEIFPKGAS
jgi:hypothetical protein